jgi:hypothetical protein
MAADIQCHVNRELVACGFTDLLRGYLPMGRVFLRVKMYWDCHIAADVEKQISRLAPVRFEWKRAQ